MTRMLSILLQGATLAVLCLATTLSPARAQANASGPTPAGDMNLWPGRGVTRNIGWDARRLDFWRNREKDQGAVVFLGDSITHFWPNLQQDFPGLKVANRGISGDTTRGVLFRLKEDVLDLHPRAVVLLISTNDLTDNGTPQDIAYNIRMMLDRIHRAAPKAPVIVCHVMPRGIEPGKFPERIQALNRLIDAAAIGRPYVTICDTWGLFATPQGTALPSEFPDMLHPNATGYAKWVAALKPIFERLGITA